MGYEEVLSFVSVRVKSTFSWSSQTGSFDCIIDPPGIFEVQLEGRDGFNKSITQQMQSTEVLLRAVAAAEL